MRNSDIFSEKKKQRFLCPEKVCVLVHKCHVRAEEIWLFFYCYTFSCFLKPFSAAVIFCIDKIDTVLFLLIYGILNIDTELF